MREGREGGRGDVREGRGIRFNINSKLESQMLLDSWRGEG